MICNKCGKDSYRNVHMIYETKETVCDKCYSKNNDEIDEIALQRIEEGLTGAEWLDKITSLQLVAKIREQRKEIEQLKTTLKWTNEDWKEVLDIMEKKQKEENKVLFWVDCPNCFCDKKYEFTEVVKFPVHIDCECGYSFDLVVSSL